MKPTTRFQSVWPSSAIPKKNECNKLVLLLLVVAVVVMLLFLVVMTVLTVY